jgi:uncharacterized Zn-finger protein
MLQHHLNRHSGQAPYQCSQCLKRFFHPSRLKAHLPTHMERKLRAKWVCRFGNCQKAFTAKGNLKVDLSLPRPQLATYN